MNITGNWYYVRRDLETVLDALFQLPPEDYIEFDSLLNVEELDALGYVRNFPHLTCLMCAVDEGDHKLFSGGKKSLSHAYSPSSTSMGLLPATCYKVYLDLRGQTLPAPRVVGCIAKCFRHEDKPLDHYRGFNFTMKEYVCLGSADCAKRHIEKGSAVVDRLMQALDIPFSYEVASDPFFDMASSVATFAQILPTKREVTFDGHAVASLNYHRNYFGRKFNISLSDTPIHSSCVAFGLERWIAMLRERFGDPGQARAVLADLLAQPDTVPAS
ncbi:MAG: hypothetical protein H0X13_15280 [Ramlibacter sp.]|nr:hypothetical protein [Ramlibacter sp.]